MPLTSVPSINLQYFFCIIFSIFGAKCTTTDVPSVDTSGALNAASSTAADAANQAGGFWSWLWPFGNLSLGSDSGVSTMTLSFLPEPVQHIFIAAGALLSLGWSAFSWLSFSVSGLLFMTILSSLAGLAFIRVREWGQYGTLPPRDASKSYGWSRWQDLLNEAMSTDPKKWRLAIVAADGMLGELLTHLGYHGETTGDQMRALPDDAFVTVPAAWEAHRIKNFVAARSSNYILTQREAFRVMKLYEQVFEEFDFI